MIYPIYIRVLQRILIYKIEQSGESLFNIINNLVDIAKVESGQMDFTINKVNLCEEMEYINGIYTNEAMEKGLDLSLSNPDNCRYLLIHTDQGKFNSILTNLLRNAIKFTMAGSISFGYELKGANFIFF